MKTDGTIVLTIFDGERCVTSLDALEAAAKAIHQKAVREIPASGSITTLGGEIEAQISLINAENGPDGPPVS